VIQADVTRPEQITAMFRKVQADFGKLDISVSNARPEAAAFFYPPMDITLEQWEATFDSQAQDLIRNWHSRGWTPMRRLGTPEDIGNVVALFCSEEAGWITGQVIYADGGASLMNPEVPPEIQLG
jgi:NAD(P)-dependent dehydrogenase (short-subunit alcohol dehydrogenase family)